MTELDYDYVEIEGNMCKCEVNYETEPHPCPYAQAIDGNNDDEYCMCCNRCTQDCAENI